MDGLSAAASVIAVADLAAKVGSQCYKYYSAAKDARRDIERLQAHLDRLKTTLEGAHKLLQGKNGSRLETSQRLRDTLNSTHAELVRIATKLDDKLNKGGRRATAMRSLGLRALEWPFERRDVEAIIASFQRDQDAIFTALRIDQAAEVLDIHHKIDLLKLPTAKGAAFNSQANELLPKCHPETRLDALADIDRWIEDPSTKCIFWLNGMAGTGKSTISRTLAARVSQRHTPMASFFFKKGEDDRGRADLFFTTIANQLVQQLPCITSAIREVIDADPAISDKTKTEQFKKLILNPLEKCRDSSNNPETVLVVVDALYECDQEEDAAALIQLFSRAKEVTSTRLRFFVTSRPELPIRLSFTDISGSYNDMVLHKISRSAIEKDISTFFRFQLAQIRDRFNKAIPSNSTGRLSLAWPSSNSIQQLVEMAVPLFIFASTACRFIGDLECGDPEEQLAKILEYRNAHTFSQLHMTYLPVLSRLHFKRVDSGLVIRSEDERSEIVAWFREIVGAIVVLIDPLNTISLARLLGTTQRRVDSKLSGLHSVLHIPPDPSDPVKLLHLSFRDFLLDSANRNANQFWVDEQDTHAKLAAQCLQLLSTDGNLRRDICDLQLPGNLRTELDSKTIDEQLQPEVQYACLHWVSHVMGSNRLIRDKDQVHCFLTHHLLHWLEALSLLGCVRRSVSMVEDLIGVVDPANSSQLSAFLSDTRRVIFTNCSVIDASPLQVYHSAIVFAPKNSPVRRLFEKDMPTWLSSCLNVDATWNSCLQTLEIEDNLATDGKNYKSVIFSPDGRWLASASRDVQLWNVATGGLVATLTSGYIGRDAPIAFSPDSRWLASASIDVRLWNVATGDLVATLTRHGGWAASVIFSPDGSRLTLASTGAGDNMPWTLELWEVAKGDRVTTTVLGCYGEPVSLAFSPDGRWLVALLSPDGTFATTGLDAEENESPDDKQDDKSSAALSDNVRLWDVATGDLVMFSGGTGIIDHVAFSPDSSRLALASDADVRLWDTATRTLGSRLDMGARYHLFSSCNSHVAFSPDSSNVAALVKDMLKFWDVATESLILDISLMNGDFVGLPLGIAFSPDGRRLACMYLEAITLLDVATGKRVGVLTRRCNDDVSAVFPPNRSQLAVVLPNIVQLLDTTLIEDTKKLDGHQDNAVQRVVFSPDGSQLASATDYVVRMWDVASGTCINTFETVGDYYHLTFSPDGSHLALGSDETTVLLDVAASKPIAILGHRLVTFSPNNSQFASAALEHGSLDIRDIATGKIIVTLDNSLQQTSCIALSSDGRQLASASSHSGINLWDTLTGRTIGAFRPPSYGWGNALAFSPDGDLLVYAPEKGNITIWDVSTLGLPIATVELGTSTLNLAFDATGSRLHTDIGTFMLDLPSRNPPATPLPQAINRQGVGLSSDRTWIMWNSHKVIWLPPAYRGEVSAAAGSAGSAVAIGRNSGGVALISFSGIEQFLFPNKAT